MKASGERCPTCRQRIGLAPVRVCSLCKAPLLRRDKYVIGEDGRIRHRHCGNPSGYLPPKLQAELDALPHGSGARDRWWRKFWALPAEERARLARGGKSMGKS